jgi:hypothetical protein
MDFSALRARKRRTKKNYHQEKLLKSTLTETVIVIVFLQAGQDLVAISDYIGERLPDLKESHPEAYRMLDEVQRIIGDYFNKHHWQSHGFGLKSHQEEVP